MFLAMALEGYADLLDARQARTLTFTVTAFEDCGAAKVVAAARSIEVGLAAYNVAIPTVSRGRLVLHQSSRTSPTTRLLQRSKACPGSECLVIIGSARISAHAPGARTTEEN
jgi:hypothetical protein